MEVSADPGSGEWGRGAPTLELAWLSEQLQTEARWGSRPLYSHSPLVTGSLLSWKGMTLGQPGGSDLLC